MNIFTRHPYYSPQVQPDAFHASARALHKYRAELKRMMYGAIYININGKAAINQAKYQRAYNSRLFGLTNAFPLTATGI